MNADQTGQFFCLLVNNAVIKEKWFNSSILNIKYISMTYKNINMIS